MNSLETVKVQLKSLLNVHYVTNFVLASNFFILKFIPVVCEYIFETCQIEWREIEILMLLMVFVAVKCRKATTFLQFVNTVCMFAKCAHIILYWREGPLHVIFFCIAWLLHFIFLPQPAYKGI
jgi:hypothetical protein